MFYVRMLQSFGVESLYFLFVLQSPSNKVGTQRGSEFPGWSAQTEVFSALSVLLTKAVELPA